MKAYFKFKSETKLTMNTCTQPQTAFALGMTPLMKTTRPQTLAARLLLLLFLLALPAVVQAADYTYTTSNGQLTITRYTGPGGAVVIPATINGRPVTRIGDYAFSQKSAITSVTIPTSVTRIGGGAFVYCTGLTSIEVDPLNSSYVGLEGVLFNKSLTSLVQYPGGKAGSYTIPDSVTSIGGFAFAHCTGLTGVYFQGQPPRLLSGPFEGANQATVYYLPGSTGWGSTFSNRPTALWLPEVRNVAARFGVHENQFGFDVSWAPGQTVVVEAATDLAAPVWSPVQTLTLAGDSIHFSDPQGTLQPVRFYRLRIP